MNIKNKDINLFIGLLKQDMKTKLKEEAVLKVIEEELINIKVIGYNINKNKGTYKGIKENSLNVNFINNYNLEYKTLLQTINKLKERLEQESILLTIKPIDYKFI
jgi:signal recognition particle receptor subunit beta